MKTGKIGRVAAAAAAALLLGVASAPASAFGLEDLGKDLGIDLGDIFGGGGRGDSFSLVERILQSELPKEVGPADRWDVRLERQGSDLARGRLRGVDVTGIDVRTNDGLVIPRMDLRLEDVKVGLGSRRLESVGKGLFSAELGEAAVTRYVQKRAGADVRDVRVRFQRGQIVVNATPDLLGFNVPSEVAGKPVLKGLDAVNFRASKVSLGGLRLPRFAMDALEDKVNPVVDLSGLKLPVRIGKLQVQGDRLVAEGIGTFRQR